MAMQNTAKSSSSFLGLPVEVRSQILRRLLTCASILKPFLGWEENGCPGLHPEILRVNQQLYAEGINLLYGQNVFRMIVYVFPSNTEHAAFMNCWNFMDEAHSRLPRYKLIQQYDICVQNRVTEGDGYLPLKCLIRRVASKMAELPSLKHLRIDFNDYGLDGYEEVLQAFTLLSNVDCVEIKGVKASYAQYLKTTMEGASRLDQLPMMRSTLDRLAPIMNEYETMLERNYGTVQESNVNDYLWVRAELVEKLVMRTQQALSIVSPGIVEPDDEYRWVVDQRYGN